MASDKNVEEMASRIIYVIKENVHRERWEICELLKAWREEHLQPGTEAGDTFSSLIAEIMGRGFEI